MRKTKKKTPISSEQNLSVVSQPTDFFMHLLTRALENQKVKPRPETEIYLVNLLSSFMLSENYFTMTEKGEHKSDTLALLLQEVSSTVEAWKKHQCLKRLGDVSLYTAGFFGDSLSRKIVDIDYYIGMGKNAYNTLSTLDWDLKFQKVFLELAADFHRFVDILAEISDETSLKNAKNLLRIYEVWLKTKSERAERHLKEAGIIPNSQVKTGWQ
jgi:hypothetical protein